MNLENNVVIITGATGGVGTALAHALVAHKAKLVLCGRREDVLNALKDAVIRQGSEAIAVTGDLTEAATANAIVDAALAAFGTIDVLVNNAGYGPPASLADTTEDIWDVTIDSCLKSMYLMTRAALPTMQANNQGRVMQVSSVAGLNGYPNRSAYCAAKWGMEGFTHAMQAELAETDIRLQTVNPAAIGTAWWGRTNDAQDDEIIERMMTPAQVADAIMWLLTQPDNLKVDRVVLENQRNPWS